MAVAVSPRPATLAVVASIYGPHDTAVGTTKKVGTPTNTPTRDRVLLHDQPTGRLLREMWSAEGTGQYQFKGLRAGTYFVVSFDHTGQYNGQVMTDVVLPAPGA